LFITNTQGKKGRGRWSSYPLDVLQRKGKRKRKKGEEGERSSSTRGERKRKGPFPEHVGSKGEKGPPTWGIKKGERRTSSMETRKKRSGKKGRKGNDSPVRIPGKKRREVVMNVLGPESNKGEREGPRLR